MLLDTFSISQGRIKTEGIEEERKSSRANPHSHGFTATQDVIREWNEVGVELKASNHIHKGCRTETGESLANKYRNPSSEINGMNMSFRGNKNKVLHLFTAVHTLDSNTQ
jgi:hypothetical protein